ncbi:YtxH domain-containing protein [Parasediminibacterium sp. JCM 36343]|uniref:YtxH domain-containing protein n=1 Tax=Parasediminibacterium sp. JCM 36343 TaxID=3374279 RepID=UPI00397B0AF9
MSTGKVVAGVLAGLVVGAAAGLLFAPEKGARTRKKIAQKGEDLKDKFDDVLDELTDKYESIKNDAESLLSKSKVHLNGIKKTVESSLS